MRRAQLSLSAIEAGVGVLLVFAVTTGFVLGGPAPAGNAQLDAYATDLGAVLANDAPRHGAATRLAEVTRSREGFDREADALAARIVRVLPENLMYRVGTEHGAVGYSRPDGVAYGTARHATPYGTVTIWVWYA
ncbi:hypothetical protein [Salarchaeum sp. JOR-1]|uniref:DUF7262 family protein n=1 Tax=Salarchaeum sp. JOR-1 TaxID=2599399 RepID=UPI0011984520|nr:hypothetical protein [Salarchaeum sp. JOR-1]QDX39835.1 hypothetical protein FQU85_02570 [Salarchaeum sp. JOR-1]